MADVTQSEASSTYQQVVNAISSSKYAEKRFLLFGISAIVFSAMRCFDLLDQENYKHLMIAVLSGFGLTEIIDINVKPK